MASVSSQAEFLRSNESLTAIISALEIGGSDLVLSVCGSGDVPFAMLEYGAKIIAFDRNPAQIELAEQRIAELRKREHTSFLSPDKNVGEQHYFSEDRLEKIRLNASNLTLVQADILTPGSMDLAQPWSKVYLSNLLDAGHVLDHDKGPFLFNVVRHLSPGGKIYVAREDTAAPLLANPAIRRHAIATYIAKSGEATLNVHPAKWTPAVFYKP